MPWTWTRDSPQTVQRWSRLGLVQRQPALPKYKQFTIVGFFCILINGRCRLSHKNCGYCKISNAGETPLNTDPIRLWVPRGKVLLKKLRQFQLISVKSEALWWFFEDKYKRGSIYFTQTECVGWNMSAMFEHNSCLITKKTRRQKCWCSVPSSSLPCSNCNQHYH